MRKKTCYGCKALQYEKYTNDRKPRCVIGHKIECDKNSAFGRPLEECEKPRTLDQYKQCIEKGQF